jgi:hypothetical protein
MSRSDIHIPIYSQVLQQWLISSFLLIAKHNDFPFDGQDIAIIFVLSEIPSHGQLLCHS